jgi:hypothetical protein
MAYDKVNFPALRRDVIGYHGDAGARVDSVKYQWSFVTTDAAATVEAANYFNAQTDMQKGDIIDAVMAVGGTPVRKMYVLTAGIGSGGAANTIALATTAAG